MKSLFLSSALGFTFLLLVTYAYSQDLDLIVSTKGDSIACRIDSINDTHIFYRMEFKGARIYTLMNRTDVSEYKQNVIDRKDFICKPGNGFHQGGFRFNGVMNPPSTWSIYVLIDLF